RALDKVILLVEEEEAIRRLAKRTLERQGYTVIEAASGEAAIELASGMERVDLVVSAASFPKMNGKDLADALLQRHPDARVLFTSEDTDDVDVGSSPHLQKPYTARLLLRRIQD